MHKPVTVTIETRTVVRILALVTVFVAGIWLIGKLWTELTWLGVAFFLAVALDPAVHWVSEKLAINRVLSTVAVFLVFIGVMGFLAASTVPPMINQTEQLVNNVPGYLQDAQDSRTYAGRFIQHYHLVSRAKAAQDHMLEDLSSGSGAAVGILHTIFNGLTAVFSVLVLTFFMLLEATRWKVHAKRFVPTKEASTVHRLVHRMYRIVSGYMTGNLIIAGLTAVVTAVLIQILGVPYAIPLGMIAGLSTLVPIVGGYIGGLVISAAALFTSTTAAVVLFVFFTILLFLDGHVLRPLVFGKTVEMSPLVVVVAILLGTAFAGMVGALVAIPLFACIGVVIEELLGMTGMVVRHNSASSEEIKTKQAYLRRQRVP